MIIVSALSNRAKKMRVCTNGQDDIEYQLKYQLIGNHDNISVGKI